MREIRGVKNIYDQGESPGRPRGGLKAGENDGARRAGRGGKLATGAQTGKIFKGGVRRGTGRGGVNWGPNGIRSGEGGKIIAGRQAWGVVRDLNNNVQAGDGINLKPSRGGPGRHVLSEVGRY